MNMMHKFSYDREGDVVYDFSWACLCGIMVSNQSEIKNYENDHCSYWAEKIDEDEVK